VVGVVMEREMGIMMDMPKKKKMVWRFYDLN
jgi:hypothetical protein